MSKAKAAGALPQSRTLSATNVLRITGLLALGASITCIHELIKTPYQIPGHRVEWMALLVIGRSVSKSKWAGTLTGIGAAAATPIFFGLNPAAAITYLIVGVVFDILFRIAHQPKNAYIIGLIAAMAYVTKPIIRIPIDMATGFPFKPLLAGAWYPMLTYTVFGFTGGLLGVVAIDLFKRLRKLLANIKETRLAT